MKATEFIKKFGLSHTVYLLKDTELTEFAIHSNCAGKYYMDTVCVSDLKRLIESHELVESKGGLIKAKEILADNPVWCFGSKRYSSPLERAIADVESCL